MKGVVYSLFGQERQRYSDCFDFNSYLRHFMINLRLNRLIYGDWQIILETDEITYNAFKKLFDYLRTQNACEININENNIPLTKAMLWRLKPVFKPRGGYWYYTHILCRDLDSPPTYRERQAVEVWIKNDKAMHAITDSVSHTLPLLGGMIGVRPDYFTEKMGSNWNQIFDGVSIDFSNKGADQTYLNQYVYPKFAQHGSDSITQHYFNGHPNTFLGDFHTCTCSPPSGHRNDCPNNISIGLPDSMKESNTICGHIGAAGFYETSLFKFLRPYWEKFEDLRFIEQEYKHIFYWAN